MDSVVNPFTLLQTIKGIIEYFSNLKHSLVFFCGILLLKPFNGIELG